MKETLEKKKRLFEILKNDPWYEFSEEDSLLLHSKHGAITIHGINNDSIDSGYVYSFRSGFDLDILSVDGDLGCHGVIKNIDWGNMIITMLDDTQYTFRFTSYNINDL